MSLPETVEVHKLTVPEFHALEPLLDPDRRHEPLDGQIIVMPIPGNPHTVALNELTAQFMLQRRAGLYVSLGGLRASETTELLPDLCLLEQKPSGPDNSPARAAKFVVEVAHTTLAYDTGDKLRAYQQAGVPEYWVMDVAGQPQPGTRRQAPQGGGENEEDPGAGWRPGRAARGAVGEHA
jgi:Uma2 family endonuclease